MSPISDWFRKQAANPQVVSLLLLLLAFWAALTFFGQVFTPIFTAVVAAYLLEGPVRVLQRIGLSRSAASAAAWAFAVIALGLLIAVLIPQVLRQAGQIAGELPTLMAGLRNWLESFAASRPEMLSAEQAREVAGGLSINLSALRQQLLSRTHLLSAGLTLLVVYLILVPIIVFFLVKDKDKIKGWLRGFLPRDIALISKVWRDVDKQLGNYMRGKAIEILIVGAVTFVTFAALGLNYAMLLAVATGVSVLIPWVGATLVTIPLVMIAYSQFGVGPGFATVLIAYGVIQALDANVLVPVLFSEANDLHPIAIIIAVLFFGLTYGVWGVFFAIPLATLVAAIINAWPKTSGSALNEPTGSPE